MTLDSGQTLEQRTLPPLPTELKIQDGEKVAPLRVDDFNALFSDIAGFNDQFSLGSMMKGTVYNNEYRNRLMPILQEIKQAFG